MYIGRDRIAIFLECDYCGEMVPCGPHCSNCGKKQHKKIELRTLSFREQVRCNFCGEIVYKEKNCTNCGFLMKRED